jgi:hypothetical protein
MGGREHLRALERFYQSAKLWVTHMSDLLFFLEKTNAREELRIV